MVTHRVAVKEFVALPEEGKPIIYYIPIFLSFKLSSLTATIKLPGSVHVLLRPDLETLTLLGGSGGLSM